jgi:uncharacterized protein YjiK
MKISFFFLLIIAALGCDETSKKNESLPGGYFFSSEENRVVNLPENLNEVSGLSFLEENYLLTHDDELGKVYKIDLTDGKILEEYSIGEKGIEKDFEGLAVVRDSVYMVTSSGELYKFSLRDQNGKIGFEKIKSTLATKNNVEGLCYDEKTNSLLLACKDDPGKGYGKQRAVYQFMLSQMKLVEEPFLLISLKMLKEEFSIEDFSPSGIEVNPLTGNYFIISANPEIILEADREGNLIGAVKLNDKNHNQPEGITFLKDGTLVLADESNGKKAKLTIISSDN